MYRQLEKNLLNSNISPTFLQYGELRPTNGWDRFGSLGHPSKFQRVLHLGFITAPTSLSGSQPNFARCLAVSWAGTLYIHFQGLLPQNFAWCKIRVVQNLLYIPVLCSSILAALLPGTPVVGISQTAALRRGRHLYSAGRPSRWPLAHILVLHET